MHNFTPEDLLQYLYNETSMEKAAAIKAALEDDWTLREKLAVLSEGQTRLDEVKLMAPQQTSLDKIMAHAEKAIGAMSTTA
jgi:hypothetical protein